MDVSVICTGSAYISSEFTYLHDGLIDWYLMPTLAVFTQVIAQKPFCLQTDRWPQHHNIIRPQKAKFCGKNRIKYNYSYILNIKNKSRVTNNAVIYDGCH
jgi:hypothetical protein